MKDPAKVVPLFAAGSPAPAANAASLPLPERLLALMQEPLDDLLVAADDVLFDWAKKAVGEEAETCFVLMRQLRRERGEVIKRFAAQLAATPPVSTGTADAFDFEALKLQDDDALEEDIAIGNMTARIAEQVQAPLAELADRVEGARRAQRPMEGLEAVQPRAICRAFTDALHAVETTISLRLLLLKLFERAMLPQLPGFYAALNLQLSDLGFERIEKDPARKPKAARNVSMRRWIRPGRNRRAGPAWVRRRASTRCSAMPASIPGRMPRLPSPAYRRCRRTAPRPVGRRRALVPTPAKPASRRR
jgi:hypothetical protein